MGSLKADTPEVPVSPLLPFPTMKFSHDKLLEICNMSEEVSQNLKRRKTENLHVKMERRAFSLESKQTSPKNASPKAGTSPGNLIQTAHEEITIVDIQKISTEQPEAIKEGAEQILTAQAADLPRTQTTPAPLKQTEDWGSMEKYKHASSLDYNQLVSLTSYMLKPPKLQEKSGKN
jgi:hypothetical protein